MPHPQPINSPQAPAPLGPYHQAIRAGDFVYLSGLVGVDSEGRISEHEGAAEQASRIFDAMEAILVESGSSLSQLVKLNTFVTDIGILGEISRVRRERLGGIKPASTLVEVSRLAADFAVVEIEAVALLGTPSQTSES